MRITVRAKPGARTDQVFRDDNAGEGVTLVVRVRARPVEGAANAAITKAVAAALGVRPRHVVLVAGSTARTKRLEITAPEDVIKAAIAALPALG